MPMLISARVLQGIGGGGLISIAQAVIGEVVPLRERGRYQSYVSVTYALASIGGPVLGGYLTYLLSWRWIFWINLPIGIIALWIARRSLKSLAVPGIRRPIDYIGILLLTAGLSSLLIGITRVGHGSSLVSSGSLWLLIVAAILVALFIRHEHHTAEPLIAPALFKIRAVWGSCLVLFSNFFQIISLSLLIPYGMQLLDGIGPDKAAVHLISLSLAIPAGAFMGGRWMSRSGRYKPMQLAGTGLLTVAMLLLAYFGPHASLETSFVLILAGLATGMTLPTSLVAVQNSVSPKDIGVATSMTALFRSMGGAIGVTILSSILFALIGTGGSAAHIETGVQQGLHAMSPAALDQAVSAFRITFVCGAFIALLAHILAWMIPEKTLRSA
jgi:MFS family permease